ncbi:MAG: hypothetical protein HQK89_02210 [Nitrospirae bacterium]|nr:hypothetical protein [Nitrospirota bacterium]
MGKRLQEERKPVGAPVGSQNAAKIKGDILSPLKTAECIAEQNQVSSRTIKNASTYATAIDRIAEICPTVKEAIERMESRRLGALLRCRGVIMAYKANL